jgi:hypothetical protein
MCSLNSCIILYPLLEYAFIEQLQYLLLELYVFIELLQFLMYLLLGSD